MTTKTPNENKFSEYLETLQKVRETQKLRRYTDTEVGRACGVKKATFSQWKSGVTKSAQDFDTLVAGLAKLFKLEEGSIRAELAFFDRSPIQSQWHVGSSSHERGIRHRIQDPYNNLDRVRSDHIAKFGFVEFGFLSGEPRDGNETFCYSLATRFMNFAGLSLPSQSVSVPLDAVSGFVGVSGTYDIVMGYFETPKRSLELRFAPFPIRIGLNAVVSLAHVDKLSREVKEALIQLGGLGADFLEGDKILAGLQRAFLSASESQKHFFPVVDKFEVGGEYAEHRLYMKSAASPSWQIIGRSACVKYDAFEYIKAMDELAPTIETGRLPIAIADENMCIRILKAAFENTHESLSMNSPVRETILLFDGPEVLPFRGHASYIDRPHYRLAWATDIDQSLYHEWFKSAFDSFIDSNRYVVAQELTKLESKLKTEFTKIFASNWSRGSEIRARLCLSSEQVNVSESVRRILDTWLPIESHETSEAIIGPGWHLAVNTWRKSRPDE